jgi:transcriptional regulator with XRE-family HTH domain
MSTAGIEIAGRRSMERTFCGRWRLPDQFERYDVFTMQQKKKPEPNKALQDAVRELRKISQESEQFFGARLRVSTRALQTYEAGERVPKPKQLTAFAAYADFVGRTELSWLFINELERQLTPQGYDLAVAIKRHEPPLPPGALRAPDQFLHAVDQLAVSRLMNRKGRKK